MANRDIRQKTKEEGVKLWQVAKVMGVSDNTLSRWLREELPQDTKREIFKAIQKIKEVHENDE